MSNVGCAFLLRLLVKLGILLLLKLNGTTLCLPAHLPFAPRVGEIEALGQFHQHFMRVFLVRKFVQSQTLSREKLLKRLSYKKWVHKIDT